MDKSQHLVTVPREYLEELEWFKAEHTSDMNAKVKIPNIYGGDPIVLLESKDLEFVLTRSSNINGIIVVDNEGREIQRFIKTIF